MVLNYKQCNKLFRSHVFSMKKNESFQNFRDLAFLDEEKNGKKPVFFLKKHVFFRAFRTLDVVGSREQLTVGDVARVFDDKQFKEDHCGALNVACAFCGAKSFKDELPRTNGMFNYCCNNLF